MSALPGAVIQGIAAHADDATWRTLADLGRPQISDALFDPTKSRTQTFVINKVITLLASPQKLLKALKQKSLRDQLAHFSSLDLGPRPVLSQRLIDAVAPLLPDTPPWGGLDMEYSMLIEMDSEEQSDWDAETSVSPEGRKEIDADLEALGKSLQILAEHVNGPVHGAFSCFLHSPLRLSHVDGPQSALLC